MAHMIKSKSNGQTPGDQTLLEGVALEFAEAALVCEAMRALWISPKFLEQMWLQLLEIIKSERLDEKWNIDAAALVNRISKLRRSEATALLRAAIRFWERREEPTAALLLELGLIRSDHDDRGIRHKRGMSPY
jgi:hypothetical protein